MHTTQYISEGVRLTWSDSDWPDENGAQRQSCDDCYASRYYDDDVMIEPHTGRTAHRRTRRDIMSP